MAEVAPAGRGPDDVAALAVDQFDHQQPPDAAHRLGQLGDQVVGLGMGEIADQHRDALAEPPRIAERAGVQVQLRREGVHRRLAAARGRLVHHVVVDQGEDVQQLERGGRLDDPVVTALSPVPAGRPAAGGHPAPETHARADPLPAADGERAQQLGQVAVAQDVRFRATAGRAQLRTQLDPPGVVEMAGRFGQPRVGGSEELVVLLGGSRTGQRDHAGPRLGGTRVHSLRLVHLSHFRSVASGGIREQPEAWMQGRAMHAL